MGDGWRRALEAQLAQQNRAGSWEGGNWEGGDCWLAGPLAEAERRD